MTTADAWPAFIATFAIISAVLSFLLLRGKMLAGKKRYSSRGLLRGRYYAEDMSPPQGERISVGMPPSPPDLIAVEQELARRILDCRHLLACDQYVRADIDSRRALSFAIKNLSGDHWLLAATLHLRATYLIADGRYRQAYGLLKPAAAIISEWPGDLMTERSIAAIATDLERCRKRL
ncbi:MAG: hypothetical protein JST01_24810 [Cyanobacteria bacterium SZAS TMP-1]|nr:hypothetical protein [Cyanobacteria bacterium SZAS TMP-1]